MMTRDQIEDLRAEVAWRHRECGPDCCVTGDRCEDEATYSLLLSAGTVTRGLGTWTVPWVEHGSTYTP